MAANPALATLFNPSTAAGAAVQRLRDTATALNSAGMRGKVLDTDDWVTLVNIERELPIAPPPGRIGPLLRAGARVATRAAALIERGLSEPLTTGDRHALETAGAWAKAGTTLLRAYATRDDVAEPDDAYGALMILLDAQAWGRLFSRLYADTYLTAREFLGLRVITDFHADSTKLPIRVDSDAQAVMTLLAIDPLLYADTWDVPALAERLAAGVEVVLETATPTASTVQTLMSGGVPPSGGGGNIPTARSGRLTVSVSPPSNPVANDEWLNPETGIRATYYNDGDSSQWVQFS